MHGTEDEERNWKRIAGWRSTTLEEVRSTPVQGALRVLSYSAEADLALRNSGGNGLSRRARVRSGRHGHAHDAGADRGDRDDAPGAREEAAAEPRH